jgi:phosphoribosylformylglycinamidine synthase
MAYEKRVHEAMREIVAAGLAESAHDLSAGGLACALAFSHLGADVSLDSAERPELLLFGEAQSRILVSTAHADQVAAIAARHQVACANIGVTRQAELKISCGGKTLIQTSTADIQSRFEAAFPKLLHLS